MSSSEPQTDNELSQHIEKLLDSANSASQTLSALHVAFMAFTTYLGVIVWGTTHEDLLRISPVKLPILDVELPLTAFYCFVPWMLVLLHFNLLMQLELLSCKLWNLDRYLPATPAGQQVRDRLFIFPFTQFIAGRSSVLLIRWLLSLVVGITLIALPLFMLLIAQIRFLPFHDEGITWSQRLAVWLDAAMLLALWPLIASPKDRAIEWWRNFCFRLLGYWPAGCVYLATIGCNLIIRATKKFWPQLPWHEMAPRSMLPSGTEPKGMIIILLSVPIVLLLSIVAVAPGSITLQSYYEPVKNQSPNDTPENAPQYFEDWLIRKVPKSWLSVAVHQYDAVSCTSLDKAKAAEASILQVMLGPCSWSDLIFSRNLNLREARLVPKEVSLSLLTRAIDPDKAVRDKAFKEFDGLNLQNRDLRFANLYGAVLPKADLRHVQLQGAILLKAKLQGVVGWDKTQLQGAILGGTQLQGAGLLEADLQGADLRGANLQGVSLGWAKLQGADLRGADLIGADLSGANLQGADLRGANFQGANLNSADLQGASLNYAKLQGAELGMAKLQGAELRETQRQGGDWSQANLDGTFIANSLPSEWNEHDRIKLETTLKALLDSEKLSAFQQRMGNTRTEKLLSKAGSQAGCYSDNKGVLKCAYHPLAELDAYRTDVLHPKLVELACLNTATALGIANRGAQESANNDPNFGLAAALLKALNTPKPCAGLASLPEHTLQTLRKTAGQQKK
jgi:uncharacterized protein YjbI with pentapeptide repeats